MGALTMIALPVLGPRPALATARAPARWYVSARGDSTGDGSRAHPWSLRTALAGPPSVRPGDTVWIEGGTYRGDFASTAQGTRDSLVVFRAVPGERATIDGSIAVRKPFIALWGFEITQSTLPGHRTSVQPGTSSPTDIGGSDASGVELFAEGVRLINLVIHDTRQGIGAWSNAPDAEIYGCLIYHNGWDAPDRGHGHAIYTQNKTGVKRITDNIIADQYGWGIHVYGSKAAALVGYDIEGNVIYGSGTSSHMSGAADILVGGGSPAARITIAGNYTWQPSGGRTVQLGYSDAVLNEDVTARDNVFIGRSEFRNWSQATVEGNLFAGAAPVALIAKVPGASPERYRWDHDTIATDAAARPIASFAGFDSSRTFDLTGWRQALGFDAHGIVTTEAALNQLVAVRPNRYDQMRGEIVVVNWTGAKEVPVDLGPAVRRGSHYEIRAAEDPYGDALATGVYRGRAVQLTVPPDRRLVAFIVTSTP